MLKTIKFGGKRGSRTLTFAWKILEGFIVANTSCIEEDR